MHLRRFIRPLVFSGLCLAPLSAWSAEAVLTGDTYVSSSSPSSAYGTLPFLNVGNGSSALVQFDLSSLPSGTTSASVTKANLILYVERLPASGALDLSSATSGWAELTTTFNTSPSLGGRHCSRKRCADLHRGGRHVPGAGLAYHAIVQFRH